MAFLWHMVFVILIDKKDIDYIIMAQERKTEFLEPSVKLWRTREANKNTDMIQHLSV